MRLLTDNEIKCLKETRITPTVIQCNEWERTIFADKLKEIEEYTTKTEAKNAIRDDVDDYVKEHYGIDLHNFYGDLVKDYDGISLEEEAPYIIYCLLTEEELDKKTDKELLEWLQDWKYFLGYRKADEYDAKIARHEAKGLFNGAREIRTYNDGSIYVTPLDNEF